MASPGISGAGVAIATAGGLLMFAGIRDVPVLDALRQVVGGQLPEGNKATEGQPTAGTTAARAALDSANAGGVASATPAVLGTGGGLPQLAQAAFRYQGVPYKWGGNTPAGLDCSGLVQLSFSDIGIKAPRTTYQQQPWKALSKISASQAGAGDLVFWPGHVAIVVSSGMVIHAPRPGKVVEVVPVGSAGPRGATPTYRRYTAGGSSAGSSGGSSGSAAPPKSVMV